MYKEDGGFHNFPDHDVAEATKDGWVDGNPVRARTLALKQKPDIVVAHEVSRRGRPRKEESAPVEVSDDGHSTEFN
jgi:hypothetical protein